MALDRLNRPDTGARTPLRVMHLVHKFGVGGMEVGITKLVNSLDGSRVESSICSSRPADSLKERLGPHVRLHEFNRREGNDPLFVQQLYRLLKRERPHVLHTHRWGTLGEGLLAARLAGVPFLVHGEHGTLETRPRNRVAQRWMWNRADRVLSVSSRLRDRMAEQIGFRADRIHVIRNGVDLNRFKPGNRAEGRAALGLADDVLVIGTVGRLVPVKDQATLLRALAQLRQSGVRFTSLIAGTGPLREELTSLAESLGLADVRLLGNRDDVDRVLGAFDVFVLSSVSEGLSNTIQEAMATGLPVVATRVGGADELVDHSRTGLLVPPSDPDALANAIAALANDRPMRERMAAAGRERAEVFFGLDRMIRDYEGLYLGLVTNRRGTVCRVQTNEA